MESEKLTRKKLLWLFKYDRDQGLLIWRNPPSKYKSHLTDNIAGTFFHVGNVTYRRIRIGARAILAHSIIWFLENDEWPSELDHIDGNGLNNHISNLRLTTNRSNQQNRHTHRKGKLVGAHWWKAGQCWRSSVQVNKQTFYLGVFDSELEAHNAYKNKLKELQNEN